MSSVTPSDSYNGYYMKRFNDLEEELKKDHARTDARSRERTEEVEQKYKDAIRRHEEKTADAVEKIRDEFQSSVEKDRAAQRAEIEAIRRNSYDKNGRVRVNEADTLKQQLQETIESAKIQHEGDQKRLAESEAAANRRFAAYREKQGERMDRIVRETRETADKSFAEASERGKSVADSQREQARGRYEELDRSYQEELRHTRELNEKIYADAQREIENKTRHADSAVEARIHKNERDVADRVDNATRKLRSEHETESNQLRGRIQDLILAEGSYMKDKAQGKADAIREYDEGWRTREQMIQENRDREIAKFKDLLQQSDEYNTHLNDRNLHERDAYFTRLLARTAAENREHEKDLGARFDKNHSELEARIKLDKARSQEVMDKSLHDAHEQRRQALENQARAYQDSIDTQRQMDNEKISTLERQLRTKSTSSDTFEIPSGVEDAVRRSVAKEYDKSFFAEADRNKRVVNALQSSYSERMQNAEAEHERALTHREQQNQAERHDEHARFMEHVSDTEYQKKEALRTKDTEHERQTELMSRAFNQASTRMRNEYESMLTNLRNDAAAKLSALRQEADFNAKMAQRSFSAKQNELIREYEKKLADQKAESDLRIEDLQRQVQLTQRDGERQNKHALDEQARMYEQRLAQSEAQHQERERTLSQNYQDELEKVKRANVLQSKKS